MIGKLKTAQKHTHGDRENGDQGKGFPVMGRWFEFKVNEGDSILEDDVIAIIE